MSSYKHYKKAFNSSYNIIEIIEFTEYILEQEPERNGLRFALGILYSASGDQKLMHKNFNEFLTNIEKIKLDPNLLAIMESKAGIHILEDKKAS